MSRFFVPPEAVKGNSIVISGREAHHILDVLRLKSSDEVVVFDGTGREYAGIIRNISRNALTVEITKTSASSGIASPAITLLQALPKKEKMDYIVEKSTELGVRSIVPVLTARTIPDWDEPKRLSQAGRWRKIATEAAKQCGRADIPEVAAVAPFGAAVKNFGDFNMRLIAILNEETVSIKAAIDHFRSGKVVIAIGPEGDWTMEEFDAAREAGFKAISLGPRVLKSDTAGLALLSILNYELSE